MVHDVLSTSILTNKCYSGVFINDSPVQLECRSFLSGCCCKVNIYPGVVGRTSR